MLRYLTALLLLPALLLVTIPAPAEPNELMKWDSVLPGTYQNVSNGGICYVQGLPRGYLFINENGSRALFRPSGFGTLRMVRGEWDPNVLVTVEQDPVGRTQLRFDAPRTPTGYWLRVN